VIKARRDMEGGYVLLNYIQKLTIYAPVWKIRRRERKECNGLV